MTPYPDRAAAGRLLAQHMGHHLGSRPLVVGVDGGGLVVAGALAEALGGDPDVLAVARLEVPGGAGLGIGAVAMDGRPLIEEDLLSGLGIDREELAAQVRRRAEDARRRQRAYGRPAGPEAGGRVVLVVDDAIGTGIALRTALRLIRRLEPAFLAAAAPVGLPAAVDLIALEADEVVCPLQPLRFGSAARWYREFPDVGEAEVLHLLGTQGD